VAACGEETACQPDIHASRNVACVADCCVRFAHGAAGPVMTGGLDPVMNTMPTRTSLGCEVVAVAPDVQANVEMFPADLSNAAEASRSSRSYTAAKNCWVPDPPVNAMETAVCPPAQFRSSQAAAIDSSPDAPTDAADAKFPAAPPRVTPETEPLAVVPHEVTMTTRPLPAVVGLSRVMLSGEAVAAPCLDWTRPTAGPPLGQAGRVIR
jgi:hypothetical protein